MADIENNNKKNDLKEIVNPFLEAEHSGIMVPYSKLDDAQKDAARELAAIAHDIMQPAQALSLFINALQQEVGICCKKGCCDSEHYNGKVKGILEKLQASSDSLHELLHNVFRSSSLNAGAAKVEISTFPMSQVLSKIGRDFDILAEQKGVELQIICRGMTVVDSDPVIVERILRNLVGNAIKYTNKNGKITVGGRRNEETGKVTIYVHDTGIGIHKDKIPRVFDYFYRASDDSAIGNCSKVDGIGIGLATVASLSRLLHTTVKVESTLGEGSEFFFELPIAPSNLGIGIE